MIKASQSNSDELYELVRLIRPVHRRLARAVEAKLEGTGVSVGMRAVMEVLEEAGAMTVPEIGRTLFLSRQQVQLMVNALEDRQLVERRTNPAHMRSSLIALTEEGETLFGEIRARENDEMDAVSGLFSSEEVRAAQKVLCAMLDQFAAFEDDPDRPRGLE